jgi:kanamycin kinase
MPDAVQVLAAGDVARAVWQNEVGGIAYEVGAGDRRRFVKWSPHLSGIDLTREVARLRWAAAFAPVPAVLDHGADSTGAWIVTTPVPGESAVSPRWKAHPRQAVVAVGEGLRALHDTLPVDDCPFTWSARERLSTAQRRAAAGLIEPGRWHQSYRHLSVDDAIAMAAEIPPVDRLVVCHGDSCAPNTIIGDDGRWSGHVDLGSLGVADRWADLAVATWSTEWNYGPGLESLLLASYGVEPDERRSRYYRLLWELGP